MLKNTLIATFIAVAAYFAFTAFPNLQIIKPAHAVAFSTNNTTAVTPTISYSNCYTQPASGKIRVDSRDVDDGKVKTAINVMPSNLIQCQNNYVMTGVIFSASAGEESSSPKFDTAELSIRCCQIQITGVFR